MATKYIDVPVTGKLRWVEVWFINNSSNPKGYQVNTSATRYVRSVKISQFNESTKTTIENTKQSSSVSATVGASYGPVSASVTGNMSLSREITDTYSGTIREQKDMSIDIEKTDTNTRNVQGYGKLGLYQAYFSAPGVDISLDVTHTEGFQPEPQEVQLMVIYTDNANDKPWDHIREVTGQNEDINSGFGGKYVWLKPIYTDQVSQALTDCRIRIQDQAWSGGNDLAKGAKGKFRYLEFNKDTNNDIKYTEVKLVRSAGQPKPISEVSGFDVLTTDINKDRKGDFLYLAFKARNALAIERLST